MNVLSSLCFFCFFLSFGDNLNVVVASSSTTNEERVFSEEQINFFNREGYIKVSGLLDENLVLNLAAAAKNTIDISPKFPFFYSVSQNGLLFGHTIEGSSSHTSTKTFRQAAIYSKIPQAAAELMNLDPSAHNLRILRDVFLAKSVEDTESCDWHVDDLGFWPESYLSDEAMDGVNAWIALDDMPHSCQGSMAIAPRSHRAEWRHRAYEALGQNRTQDGGKSKEEVVRRIQRSKESAEPQSKYPTCDMALVDAEIRETVDSHKFVPDYKRGDVIFATRLLFHRTMPVTEAGSVYYRNHGIEHLSRYSVRYVPGTARLPKGWSVELSIVANGENAGRSLDGVVSHSDKLFYPQVWPALDESDDLQADLDKMGTSLPDLAQKAQTEFMSTIFGNHQPSS